MLTRQAEKVTRLQTMFKAHKLQDRVMYSALSTYGYALSIEAVPPPKFFRKMAKWFPEDVDIEEADFLMQRIFTEYQLALESDDNAPAEEQEERNDCEYGVDADDCEYGVDADDCEYGVDAAPAKEQPPCKRPKSAQGINFLLGVFALLSYPLQWLFWFLCGLCKLIWVVASSIFKFVNIHSVIYVAIIAGAVFHHLYFVYNTEPPMCPKPEVEVCNAHEDVMNMLQLGRYALADSDIEYLKKTTEECETSHDGELLTWSAGDKPAFFQVSKSITMQQAAQHIVKLCDPEKLVSQNNADDAPFVRGKVQKCVYQSLNVVFARKIRCSQSHLAGYFGSANLWIDGAVQQWQCHSGTTHAFELTLKRMYRSSVNNAVNVTEWVRSVRTKLEYTQRQHNILDCPTDKRVDKHVEIWNPIREASLQEYAARVAQYIDWERQTMLTRIQLKRANKAEKDRMQAGFYSAMANVGALGLTGTGIAITLATGGTATVAVPTTALMLHTAAACASVYGTGSNAPDAARYATVTFKEFLTPQLWA
jgi:hypothetical protein